MARKTSSAPDNSKDKSDPAASYGGVDPKGQARGGGKTLASVLGPALAKMRSDPLVCYAPHDGQV